MNIHHNKQSGVTLIEIVIVIIALSIVAIPMSNGLLSVSKTLSINAEINQANNLAQACAEHLLYQRRIGTTTFATTDCDGVTGFAANGNLQKTASDSTTNAPLCPVPATGTTTCDELTITANNSGGQSRAVLKLFFIYNP